MTAAESINLLLSQVKPTLLMAGVPEQCIRIKDGKHRIDAYNRAFDWLHNLKMSSEYVNLLKVRALLPEDTWRRYDTFEITDLREQILLSEAKRGLLKQWSYRRPAMFKRSKK